MEEQELSVMTACSEPKRSILWHGSLQEVVGVLKHESLCKTLIPPPKKGRQSLFLTKKHHPTTYSFVMTRREKNDMSKNITRPFYFLIKTASFQ